MLEVWQDYLKGKQSQGKGFRFSRTGERTRKGVTFRLREQALKVRSKIEAVYMRQFAFNLWTINIQESACLLTFTFFLTNSGAQMCNIEGHHHRCAQLLTKAAVLCARTLKSKMEGEASQTTAKSKWSRFKQEMGNTTCLAVAFACAAQPSSTGNIPRIFSANSSVWKLLKYLLNPQAAERGLFNP